MAQKRKNYSKQFKVDAVKLITEQGYKVSGLAVISMCNLKGLD